MDAIDRIGKIAKFAKESQETAIKENPKLLDTLTYRWEHTLRVAQYGKILAEKEGANIEIVVAGCLLHDIAKLSHRSHNVEHGRIGAKIIRPFLQELDYSSADVENICFSVANHVDGKSDFEHPLTMESQIVSDADKIDRLSTYRMMIALQKYIDSDYEVFITQIRRRLDKFEKARQNWLVQTESGKVAFEEQISVQVTFLERIISDYERTVLLEL